MKVDKYITININIKEIILLVIQILMLFWTQAMFANYLWLRYAQLVLLMVFFGLSFKTQYDCFRLNSIFNFNFEVVFGPYFLITVLSLFDAIVFGAVNPKYSFDQCLNTVLPCVLAYFLVEVLEKKIVDLIWIACIINYSYYVLTFISKYGFGGLVRFIQISEIEELSGNKILEVHEVTFILGLFIVYYLININRYNKARLLITLIYFTLGFKRILFPAVFLSVFLFHIYKKNNKKLWSWSIFLFLLVYIWLYFVNSPYYELLASYLHIELNSRTFSENGLYGRLANYYSLSPLYLGKGNGFVLSVMQYYKSLGFGTVGFHNDILKYYIDLGYIPFMAYVVNMVFLIPYRINKHVNKNAGLQYLALLTVTLICWTTDNLAEYPNYLLTSFVLYYILMKNNFEGGIYENSNCYSI